MSRGDPRGDAKPQDLQCDHPTVFRTDLLRDWHRDIQRDSRELALLRLPKRVSDQISDRPIAIVDRFQIQYSCRFKDAVRLSFSPIRIQSTFLGGA